VKKSFLDSIEYKYFLKYLYPKDNTKLYKYYQNLLAKAMVFIKVEDLWNIKLLLAIITIVAVFMISKSNVYYSTMEIINAQDNSSALLFAGNTSQEEVQKTIEENTEKEKQIFEKVKIKYDYKNSDINEVSAVTQIAQYIETNKLTIDDVSTEDLARRIYKKLQNYYAVQETDYFGILLIVTFVFYIPELYLMFKAYMLKFYIYNEYLKLEVTAIMVGKLEPIKVEEILDVLSDNCKYFKRHIDEIRANYFNVKDGNAKAFETVIVKVAHKELRYLLKALQQAAEGDLKMTIENLENQRRSNKEYRNIIEQNKLKKKELIGILIILIILATVCSYAFTPFESLMNSFSI